jgi:hypothetical protein
LPAEDAAAALIESVNNGDLQQQREEHAACMAEMMNGGW